MFEFDLQRFDDELPAQDSGAPPSTDAPSTETTDENPLPEELNGLPDDIARETLEEWEQSQTDETTSPAESGKPPGAVPYDRFKEKVDEANQLKAQLAQYQQQFQQFQQAQQQQVQQQPPLTPLPQFQPPQIKITPEISQKINAAIEAEAMALTGMTKDDVASLEYADDDDPRLPQWKQAKTFATSTVFNAIRQAQYAQQVKAQQFLANHAAAVQNYNDYASKAFAEPDFKDIQNFATNDFFLAQSPQEQQIIANSYLQVSRNLASPAEMMVIKNYFERAKSEYRSRARGAKKPAQTPAQRTQQAVNLPRTDQIRGTAATVSDGLSEHEIEKMLEGDFTKLDPKKQRIMLGLT